MSSLVSHKKAAENLAIADENYEKAKKKVSTNLFRWKPDWEQAARYYREAAKYYRMSGPGQESITVQTLRESAIAHKEILSYHTAAADLEAAAKIIVGDREGGNAEASALYAESAMLYRLQGSSYEKSAAMLLKAADTIGPIDVNNGVEYVKQACSIFEEENREAFHDATFKKAISFCCRYNKFGSARSLLQREMTLARKQMGTFGAEVYKCCLSIIVLRFHTEDYQKAAEALTTFESVENFAMTDECRAASELVSALEEGDADRFREATKKNVFKYLQTPINSIARRLQLAGDAATATIAAAPEKKQKKKAATQEGKEGVAYEDNELEEHEVDLR